MNIDLWKLLMWIKHLPPERFDPNAGAKYWSVDFSRAEHPFFTSNSSLFGQLCPSIQKDPQKKVTTSCLAVLIQALYTRFCPCLHSHEWTTRRISLKTLHGYNDSPSTYRNDNEPTAAVV